MFEKFTDIVTTLGQVIARFVQTVQSAASDSLKMIATKFLPFLVLISIITGIVNGSGIGTWLAGVLAPLASSIWGLLLLSFIVTIPVVSPVLAPASVVAAIIGTLVGEQIGTGAVPVNYALPALWAVNAQVSCDSIAVQLGFMNAEEETIVNGVPAYLLARWVTGPIGVLVGYLFSIGMY